MALTRAEIQEYLYQLSSKKGFLTEQEIEKCCDENDVDFFDIDKIMQFLIDRKVLIQDEAPVNDIEDEGYDRAQVDYNEIYEEALKRFPEQKYLIEELKRTLPPQRNEWQTLVPQAKQGNLFARNRIINMYARNLFRSAYNFCISYGSVLNNSFEDAIFGLLKALDSYDITSPIAFPGYYPYYVYGTMQRNYELLNSAYEIPNHHYQDLFQFLTPYKPFIEKYGIHDFLEYVPERKIIELKEKNLAVYKYLTDLIEYDFNKICYEAKIEELILYDNLHEQIMKTLQTLKPNEKEVIIKRFGLIDGNELTLEEVGQQLNVTRERIRQIESKALKKLRLPSNLKQLEGFYSPKISINEIGESIYTAVYSDIYTKTFCIKNTSEKNEFSNMAQ